MTFKNVQSCLKVYNELGKVKKFWTCWPLLSWRYSLLRNAGCARSRYTLKFFLINESMNQWMNEWINYQSISRTAHPPLKKCRHIVLLAPIGLNWKLCVSWWNITSFNWYIFLLIRNIAFMIITQRTTINNRIFNIQYYKVNIELAIFTQDWLWR